MKNILVPCDFSDPAKAAFRFAVSLMNRNNGQVFVLYVIDISFLHTLDSGVSHADTFNIVFLKKMEEDVMDKFEKMKKEASVDSNAITLKIDYGSVTQTISSFVADHAIDLIVMGTHGSSGALEFLVGSTTERIVRNSPAPVMALRTDANVDAIRNIVFPWTMEESQQQLVPQVMELQEFFKARLHVLWINTPQHFQPDIEVNSRLREFAEKSKLSNYTLNIRNDKHEQDGIINFVREINADMIAMGTHGRKGILHWIKGSITEDVVNHVHCPIWTHTLKKTS